MKRRLWPVALAVASILVLGSYLAFTQHLVRLIRGEAAVHVQIYSIVQQGMLRVGEEGAATLALMDLQEQLGSLDVPIIALNADGEPYAAENLPFEADLSDPGDREEVRTYARRLATRRPGNRTVVPGVGEVVFGDPPLLWWLRWVPFLQVGAGALLIVLAAITMRASIRAHREQLWSSMARELAHQMATPLSSLSGWVEVTQLSAAERNTLVTPERLGLVMQADVERLERVSRRFELIGKPQALEPVSIESVVDELICYFDPRLPHLARGIRLRSRVEPGLPHVMADRVLLVWALENIIKNGIDALAGRGGRISVLARSGVSARRRGGSRSTVHVVIADNGPGIAASVRDSIFEPGVSTKRGGWGVGLSLTRRIIGELHQGRITVEQRPSGGTVFDVSLPAVRT
jgi:signal transduction histidine kinase